MRTPLVWVLVGLALAAAGCSAPKLVEPVAAKAAVEIPEAEVSDVRGAAGGTGEESLSPNQLTGVPGIDRAQELNVRILDARGNGRLGIDAIVPGKVTEYVPGQWMLTEADSEYEITLRSALLPDGIVRLDGQAAFLIEPPTEGLPRFRLFGGHASFYLPHLPLGELTVLTPAGPLVTRGAVFSVTVSPDFQVLIACRDGTVYLTGSQNAVAQPGQVVVADRLGRGRVYAMTPNEALVFSTRWLKIMTEEAAPVVAAVLPRRLDSWRTPISPSIEEEQLFTALWFRQAKTVLASVPGPDVWSAPLIARVEASRWRNPLPSPGLLGELP